MPEQALQPPGKSEARIGILLVHGIGDQGRNEHLQAVSDYLVKTLVRMHGANRVAVEMFPGANNRSPLSILLAHEGRNDLAACIDVHEMWWRDLGERPRTSALFKFWLWALSLAGTRGYFCDKPGATNPDNRSTRRGRITFPDRLTLFAKTTYFFILLTPLALVFQLLSTIPGVRRIAFLRTVFTYLSSVQMYQERRSQQSGMLTEFDQSRRISIQRRMANALIDMAERNYDRWYIFAHSLGSVIAFKGLMYDGNAFAKFVGFNRWHHERFTLKTAQPQLHSEYPDEPKSPIWLKNDDAVDLKAVYAKLRGLVTYGSPLETFARTWPAIVQINDQVPVPPDFEWVNLHDPVDIVGSRLTSFGEAPSDGQGELKPKNITCRAHWLIAKAHNGYFLTQSRNMDNRIMPGILSWVLDGDEPFDSSTLSARVLEKARIKARRMYAMAQWVGILLLGCLVWPYSIIMVSRAVMGMVGVALIFSPSASKAVNTWHASLVSELDAMTPSLDYWQTGIRVGEVIGCVALALAVCSVIHNMADRYFDARDANRTLLRKQARPGRPPPALDRPSISIDS